MLAQPWLARLSDTCTFTVRPARGRNQNVAHDVITHPRNPLGDYNIAKQLPVEKQASINILMLGCDVDYENDRPVILKNSRGRSDSIMIAKLDFIDNSIHVLSIPRDTAVHIPGHSINKINAANALEGPDLTAETIKDTFGIDTDYYVSINFETFRKIVDKIGGVDLTVEKDLDYDDNWGNLHVHLKPGPQHLTGYQAMGYVRIRHSDDDLHRAARQHAFLEAIRDKVKTPTMFEKVPDLMNTVADDVHTQLNMDQLISIANWARTVPKENVFMETMPSFEGYSYVTVNVPKAEETIRRLFFDANTVVTVNAPGMSVVDNITGRGRKNHKKGKGVDAQTLDSGSDEPLIPVSDGPDGMPADDGGTSAPPSSADNPKSGGSGTSSKDDGSKTGDGTKGSDGTKGGGGDSGKSGTDQKTNSGDGNTSGGV